MYLYLYSSYVGTKAVDESHCADMQGRLVQLRRPRAVGLQALRDDPQENTQHHVEHGPVALHEVTPILKTGSGQFWDH